MRIAHFSDVHIVDGATDFLTRVANIGKRIDPGARRRKLLASLRSGMRDADHVIVTGDLTDVGLPGQFEAFAEVLDEACIDPDRITLVPGNHDAYAAPDAWSAALRGPLARYRAGAADRAGKVVDRGSVAILPLDVSIHQPLGLAAGALDDADAWAIERRLRDLRDRAVVIALHHHPFPHASRAWQWIDGLRGCERLMAALAEHPNVHVLHGHLHYTVDRAVAGRPCIHGATATVEDPIGLPRIRFYDVMESALATPRERVAA